ncbi:PREDICTED: trihelix transcription factor ASIL2-like [Camelina sativa]|uniref:Trihelix transcription factor ASIL2-like n=1 Tax=Camelina sativa TaxID=90675 RepID=A0ABM0ZN27_CAMSA|nr:PREDICTED: trihelix transcription factor ASIL2-like [Camelina sativa]
MSDPDSPMNHDPIPDPSPVRIQSSPPSALVPPSLSSPAQDDASAEPVSVTDLKSASIPSAASKNSRRLPPPCWSLEETVALIDGYRDKWYALNRGNLKANHWEEVADAVGTSCPDVTPKKTAVQCRHKMEKLRKRYRTEIQRARSVPVARFISSWVHFKRMEAMENRPEIKQGNESGDDEDHDDGNYTARYQFKNGGGGGGGGGSVARTTPGFFNRNGTAGSGTSSGGIRIRIPTGVSLAQPGPRFPGKIDQKYTASPSSNPRPGRGLGVGAGGGSSYSARVGRIPEGGGGKRGREMMMMMKTEEDDGNGNDPMVEIASAIKLLGDTMLRTEQTRMEMTREIEAMRMDTEMKRTKMILESQQRIVESFAKTIAENTEEKMKRKARRMAAADSLD